MYQSPYLHKLNCLPLKHIQLINTHSAFSGSQHFLYCTSTELFLPEGGKNMKMNLKYAEDRAFLQ